MAAGYSQFSDNDPNAKQSDSFVATVLEEYGAMTRKTLANYLPKKEPRRYLYDLVADYPNRGGKMMRSSICIATCKAFGGTADDALLTAVSVELLHNALLIHDDIEDESEERRGGPTMHKMYGIPMAINVGDTLTLLSLRPLLDNHRRLGMDLTFKLVKETEIVACDSAEGQAMELGWRMDNTPDVSERDYLDMVLKKTCSLATMYPVRIGALIGTHGAINPARFTRFGFFLGAAFQIQDDLLNLFADDGYGKELNGDLWEGKRTLMLIHLLRECRSDERERIVRFLGLARDSKSADEVDWLRRRIDCYGSIDYAREYAMGMAGAALEEFSRAFGALPASRDKEFLERLSIWVFERH